MARDELDSEYDRLLSRHAEATESVAPAEGLTQAVMDAVAKERPERDALAGIARATSALEPDGALTEAVLSRVARRRVAPPVSWLDGVVRSAPLAIGMAAVAAAASLWIFLSDQGDLDVSVVSSVDAVEVSE